VSKIRTAYYTSNSQTWPHTHTMFISWIHDTFLIPLHLCGGMIALHIPLNS